MAEQVQDALDQMVAPLRDLMDRQIFSEEEIRSIVSRRRESEYLLRRRAARKADFVRYIEAEMLLEKLRALRTARRKRDHRKAQREKGIVEGEDADDDLDENGDLKPKRPNQKEDDPIGDVHVVQHIHLLFVRAIRKFRGDLSLHLQHAEFCRSAKSWTRLGRVYAEALQVFPREAGIWIEAASNEFFGPNRSVESARVLLQRALRLNGNSSEELWVQYFTLELHYAQTLKGRRKILRPDENNDEDDSDDNDDNETEQPDDSDYNKIAMIILKNAIRSIPKNIKFRLKFLDACQKFPDTADLMEYVQASMANDFANEPESWIARAFYQVEKAKGADEPSAKRARTSGTEGENDAKDPVLAVLSDAIDTLRTSEMLLQAFRFAEDYRGELEQNENADSDAIEQVDDFIHEIWVKARDGSIPTDSSELAIEHTHYLLRQGKDEDALRIIKAHCTSQSRPVASSAAGIVSSDAWFLWASLASSSPKKQASILKRGLQKLPVDKHPDYVAVLLQYFSSQLRLAAVVGVETGNDTEKNLFDTLQQLLVLAPKTFEDLSIEPGSTGLDFELRDVFEGYTACLDHFYQCRGIAGARSVYEAVLFRSTAASGVTEDRAGPVRGFVDRCLELEHRQQQQEQAKATGSKSKRRILCKLYDKAMDIFAETSIEESYRNDRNERAVFA
mmetsp:Transcript_14580/g.33919  ORF Transcript_14580/g.33919 Transcript_14580/m.33919 type:complete len:676 (+) Transcript_14580:169-2196(+)|eukprot:CAMPEP_0197190788 /NCGR_PEP_ID=MMETSP1423-20130617/22262_1 /TAXON_ID=476441 /ORGANISM="Pseudo-nitzschia heimii, Strain UNC1101" /LENGTH=675 /DNA_ID=CAMNT_0042643245 /DNA_START=141 /DNA_END=2168 /DNA_ORIENTATION=+